MNLYAVDWAIVAFFILCLTVIALGTKRYTQSVSDFLAANRSAGRYLLAVSEGVVGLGAISVIGAWEVIYEVGFTSIWWSLIWLPVSMIIALTGFVIYRYRQTRVMTLAQFLEIRYSKKLRIFSGLLAFTAGVINFGIFPAVGTRFFIYFCGLPQYISIFGFEVSTYVTVMVALISTALLFTWLGGQIVVMFTDFFQGIFCNIVFLVILGYVVFRIDWSQIAEAFATAPAGHSPVHPFRGAQIENFNVWFYLIGAFGLFYNHMSWQGHQGYNCSAKSPHEAKMSKILATWRLMAGGLLLMLLGVIAYTLMHHPDHISFAGTVDSVLATIDNPTIQRQMTTPIVLAKFLPIGLRGALCAVLFAAFISTHDTYMHSWGTIFIQDVIMPFRKKPFEPKQHMRLMRLSILGVAIFIFLFSMLFRQTQAIFMFFALTGAIFIGGSGAVIIGGLYWKRGTIAAAWGAMITGVTLATTGFVLQQAWPRFYDGVSFPINSQYVFAITMLASSVMYVVLSLLKNQAFNMDRMLHRGEYAVLKEEPKEMTNRYPPLAKTGFSRILRALGLSEEFSYWDKVIFVMTIVWNMGWFTIFLVGTVYNLIYEVDDSSWMTFWKLKAFLAFALGTIITIWWALGGFRDVKRMIVRLRTVVRDDEDDGMVIDHHNRDES